MTVILTLFLLSVWSEFRGPLYKSTDTDTRRKSRQELANINNSKATDQLLDELLSDKMNYRVKLGVASALYQAKNPVVIANPNHVRALVELIGDDDVLIRKYASEALMKFTEPTTVKLVHGELNRIINSRKSASPNAVYNAVVVLGTWLRILPSNLIKELSIRSNLYELKKQLKNEGQWKKTSALIGEFLHLNDDITNDTSIDSSMPASSG